MSGSFSYIGDDGQTYSISYTADENGYHPVGDHLPTPPPIPEAILKSLELTAGNDGKYLFFKLSGKDLFTYQWEEILKEKFN